MTNAPIDLGFSVAGPRRSRRESLPGHVALPKALVLSVLLLGIGLDTRAQPLLPPARKIVVVSDAAGFSAALAAAAPGESILLRRGNYVQEGGFELKAAGTANLPIVIRAELLLESTLSSNLTVHGSFTQIYGLTFANAQLNFARGSADGKILRCRFVNHRTGRGPAANIAAPRNETAYNAFVDCDGINLNLQYLDAADNARESRVHHNHFYYSLGFGATRGNGHEAFRFGEGNNSRDKYLRCTGEYNLIERFMAEVENESISIKSCGNIIRGNTLLGSEFILNRMGYDNVYEANWLEGGLGLGLRDGSEGKGNLVVGNLVKNCNPGLVLMCGVADPDTVGDLNPTNNKLPSRYARLVANTTDGSSLELGYNQDAKQHQFPVGPTMIAGHTYLHGSRRIDHSNASGPMQISTTEVAEVCGISQPIPKAIRLTPADVGPLAACFDGMSRQ